MSHQSSSADRYVLSPAQVWTRLAAECRTRAICLMAQMAFNLVAAQSDAFIQESNHVLPSRHTQNSA